MSLTDPPDLKRTQPSRLESTLRQDVRKVVRSIFWGFEDIQFQDSFATLPHTRLLGFVWILELPGSKFKNRKTLKCQFWLWLKTREVP